MCCVTYWFNLNTVYLTTWETLELAMRTNRCEGVFLNESYETNDEPRRIQPFDCRGDSTNAGPRWWWWRKAFQFYVDGHGITGAAWKKALLLHCAGMEVQDVFETLRDPGAPDGEMTMMLHFEHSMSHDSVTWQDILPQFAKQIRSRRSKASLSLRLFCMMKHMH